MRRAVPSTVVRRRRKFGGGFLFGKTETRLPVEGSFGNKFLLIYNHCGVIAAWSRKTLKKLQINFLGFVESHPLRGNFQNSVPKGFITTLMGVLCSNFTKFGWREISEIVHCLPDEKQNFAWLSRSCYCMDCARNLPGPVPQNVFRVLQISSKLVHFLKLKPSFEANNNNNRLTSLRDPRMAKMDNKHI